MTPDDSGLVPALLLLAAMAIMLWRQWRGDEPPGPPAGRPW